MGFWDSIGRVVKNAVGDAVSKEISNTTSSASATNRNDWDPSKEHKGYKQSLMNQYARMYKKKPNSLSNGDVVANFENLLYTEFLEYEIRADISATEIGGTPGCVRYTFGMYKDGYPVVFIMLTPPGNQYLKQPYIESKDVCMRNGIKFVNFFTHFENDRTYVINRIKEYL